MQMLDEQRVKLHVQFFT